MLALRTQVFAEASYENFRLGAEFIDSRITLETGNTPVTNGLVNEAALLQAYLAWKTPDLFGSGLDAAVEFGRQTMNIGSRRLVARNRFRNTINNFDGLDFIVSERDNWQWHNLFDLPWHPRLLLQYDYASGDSMVGIESRPTLPKGNESSNSKADFGAFC